MRFEACPVGQDTRMVGSDLRTAVISPRCRERRLSALNAKIHSVSGNQARTVLTCPPDERSPLIPLAKSLIWQRPNRPHGAGAWRPPLGSGAGAAVPTRPWPRALVLYALEIGEQASELRWGRGEDAINLDGHEIVAHIAAELGHDPGEVALLRVAVDIAQGAGGWVVAAIARAQLGQIGGALRQGLGAWPVAAAAVAMAGGAVLREEGGAIGPVRHDLYGFGGGLQHAIAGREREQQGSESCGFG